MIPCGNKLVISQSINESFSFIKRQKRAQDEIVKNNVCSDKRRSMQDSARDQSPEFRYSQPQFLYWHLAWPLKRGSWPVHDVCSIQLQGGRIENIKQLLCL